MYEQSDMTRRDARGLTTDSEQWEHVELYKMETFNYSKKFL
jgi:hypothetical protein